jgi:hypothetical protein
LIPSSHVIPDVQVEGLTSSGQQLQSRAADGGLRNSSLLAVDTTHRVHDLASSANSIRSGSVDYFAGSGVRLHVVDEHVNLEDLLVRL